MRIGHVGLAGDVSKRTGPCPMSLTIRHVRQALLEEREMIHALVGRAYRVYVRRIGQRPAPMDDDYESLIRSGHVFAIDNDDVLVGVIVLKTTPQYLLIENIAVEPAKQKQGFGRALLMFAERQARAAGLTQLRLYTNQAMTENIELYVRSGWRRTPKWDELEDRFQRVYFVKQLD